MKKENTTAWKIGLRLGLVQVQKLTLIPTEYKFASKLMTAIEFLDTQGFPKYEDKYDFLVLTDLDVLSKEDLLKFIMKVKGYSANSEYNAIIVSHDKDLRSILSDLNGRMTIIKA